MCHVCKSSQKWGQGLFLKTKKFAGTKNKFFFYKDQNLNGLYFQGRVQYLSLKTILTQTIQTTSLV